MHLRRPLSIVCLSAFLLALLTLSLFIHRQQAALAADPSFPNSDAYPVGVIPSDIVSADLNADGLKDLVTANLASDTVTILTNKPSEPGSFVVDSTIPVGDNPLAVAVGDFNNDALPDVVVANMVDDTLTLLLNQTASPGNFTTTTLQTIDAPQAIAVGDLNNDSYVDMVVSSMTDDQAAILLNNSSTPATFQTVSSPIIGDGQADVAVGNLNNDALLDIAITDSNSSSVSLLFNKITAPGTFENPLSLNAGGFPDSIAIGDFNNDALQDLAITSIVRDAALIMENQTATPGFFIATETINPGDAPKALAVDDMNADGISDLVFANAESDNVSLYLNEDTSPVAYVYFTALPTGNDPVSLVVDDFNNDTKPDIATTNAADNSITTLINATEIVPTPTPSPTPSPIPSPSVTPSPTPSPIPQPLSDVAIQQTHSGDMNFSVGQTYTTTLSVSTTTNSGPISGVNPIRITSVLPLGIDNVTVSGTGWRVSKTSSTSPLLISAIYTGFYPVTPGLTLPPIMISSTLTDKAIPQFLSTAIASVAGDEFPANNTAIDVIAVLPTLSGTPVQNDPLPDPTYTQVANPSTPNATIQPLPDTLPDLALMQTFSNASIKVGQPITSTLFVKNTSTHTFIPNTSMRVVGVLPVGMTQVLVDSPGSDWVFNVSSKTSPLIFVATYQGTTPLPPGASLPPITFAGIVTQATVPQFSSTATIQLPGDSKPENNQAINTIIVTP